MCLLQWASIHSNSYSIYKLFFQIAKHTITMEGLRPIRVSKEDSEDGQPLSPMARMFHQPHSNVYIIIILGFKTSINPLAFEATLRHSLLKHPRFSSLQVINA